MNGLFAANILALSAALEATNKKHTSYANRNPLHDYAAYWHNIPHNPRNNKKVKRKKH